MELIERIFNEVLVLKPKIFEDQRGYFTESFNKNSFDEILGKTIDFVQDNQSMSLKNVVRGLHLQAPPFSQAKLVRVVSGKAIDVVVDIRKNSPTYGQWKSIVLSAENRLQVYIPEGFAHGFSAIENNTVFLYKCSKYYNKASELSIHWNDPTLHIDWGLDQVEFVSKKDLLGIPFTEFISPF